MRGGGDLEDGLGAGGVGGNEGEEEDGAGELDEEAYRDAVSFRLDGLGYRVGQGLSERYVRPFYTDSQSFFWRVRRRGCGVGSYVPSLCTGCRFWRSASCHGTSEGIILRGGEYRGISYLSQTALNHRGMG